MIEYEYSFKVTDIKPFINFCEIKNYQKQDKILQTRILYKNGNGILARITTNEINNEKTQYLNFKEENESDNVLKKSKETSMLVINNQNSAFIESMLDFFDFYENKVLKRTRYIYENDKVKFEIDNYIEPEMQVVAIEGEKDEVDMVYKELEPLYKKYKL